MTTEKRFQKQFEELAPQYERWGATTINLATLTPEARKKVTAQLRASFTTILNKLSSASTEPFPMNGEYGTMFGHEQRNDDASSIDLKLYLQFAPQDVEHLEVFEVGK